MEMIALLITGTGTFAGVAGLTAPSVSEGSPDAPSSATTFTVNGTPYVNGNTVNLAHGTTSVTIAATNGGSIESLTGDSGLSEGDNACTFTVRAEDGSTTLNVTLNLDVAAATPSSATTFTVDTNPHLTGDTLVMSNGTTSVTIAAADGGSIENLTGDTGLVTGHNVCTFTVRAEDGATTLDVTLNLDVEASTSCAFLVASIGVANGATLELIHGATEVPVEGLNHSTIEDLAGDTGLVDGNNALTFTVRAEDGVTTLAVSITLHVAFSSATTFTVDGVPHLNGDTVNLVNGTTSVTIAATDGGSIEFLEGASGLVTGGNGCGFNIVAADGITVVSISIQLYVLTTGVAQVTEFEFVVVSGLTLTTLAGGKYLCYPTPADWVGVWFRVNEVETQPDLSGSGVTSYVVVDVSSLDGSAEVASAFATAIGAVPVGSTVTLTSPNGALRTDAHGGDSNVVVTVVTTGEDPS